jgi:hypothetical protein
LKDGLSTLREPVPPYGDHFDGENEALRPNDTVPWQTKLETNRGLACSDPNVKSKEATGEEKRAMGLDQGRDEKLRVAQG